MNKKTRIVIIILCVCGSLLISTGLILQLKAMDERVYYLINPDNSNYYTVKINLNGASSVENKYLRCKIEQGGCYVTLPFALRYDGEVLGYGTNENDKEAKYLIGSSLFVNDNIELYVISYKENTLTVADNNVDYLEEEKISCKAYNASKKCNVVLPQYNKEGYENKGYSTSSESLTGFIYARDNYEINKDTTIYPIYSTSSRHQTIKISKVLNYNDSFIEIEDGCKESVYQELLGYLDEIKQKAPYMLIGNKISFISDDTFNKIWGRKYVGMNYGPRGLRSVDIRCSDTVYNDYYATMVHEMAHSWDFYYATRLEKNISSQSDIINLYNKYNKESNKIFREYSFSNIYEFMADIMRYYYFKYYVPRNPFISLNYPDDIKKTLEKYICISQNEYDESKCK